MRGAKAKRLRAESTVSVVVQMDGTDELVCQRPHPGRKYGGTVGPDRNAGAKRIFMPKIQKELGDAMKKAFGKETNDG